jgi:prepilin-type N-terminal cleavage/methylation domain-containing protein
MRRGFTFPEATIALIVIGLLAAVTIPRLGMRWDALRTDRAAHELASFYTRARFAAVFQGKRVRVTFTPDRLEAAWETPVDSVFLVAPGPARHGVSLTASRPVIRIGPDGLGWGAANTRLLLRRGAAVESLTTSRLGRLRRWP